MRNYLMVEGFCSNEACKMFDRKNGVLVDLDELPEPYGSFSGPFAVCEWCESEIDVMFDVDPKDLEWSD